MSKLLSAAGHAVAFAEHLCGKNGGELAEDSRPRHCDKVFGNLCSGKTQFFLDVVTGKIRVLPTLEKTKELQAFVGMVGFLRTVLLSLLSPGKEMVTRIREKVKILMIWSVSGHFQSKALTGVNESGTLGNRGQAPWQRQQEGVPLRFWSWLWMGAKPLCAPIEHRLLTVPTVHLQMGTLREEAVMAASGLNS